MVNFKNYCGSRDKIIQTMVIIKKNAQNNYHFEHFLLSYLINKTVFIESRIRLTE